MLQSTSSRTAVDKEASVLRNTRDPLLSGNMDNTNVISSDKLTDFSEIGHASLIGTSNQVLISSADTKASQQFLNPVYLFCNIL